MAVMSDFVSDFGGVTRLPRKADQHDMPTKSKVLLQLPGRIYNIKYSVSLRH